MLSITVAADEHLRATRADAGDDQTFISDLPARACDPEVIGRWRHFKGSEYEFRAVVRSGVGAPLVLYRDAKGGVWLRPLGMIGDAVVRDGRTFARFVRVSR